MVDLIISPGGPLTGERSLPGDKSISHRAALFAALAEGESRIENWLDAGVTRVMLHGLSTLGVRWERHTGKSGRPAGPIGSDSLIIKGVGLHGFKPAAAPLDCGHSGTTIRFLAGALGAAGTPAVLDGSAGLRRRPMRRVVEPLRSMGVPIQSTPQGTAPLELGARSADQRLKAGRFELPVASAQVKTALLLASLAAEGETTLAEPVRSRDHTERLLGAMGVKILEAPATPESGHNVLSLQPPEGPLRPLHLTIPGDFSSAAFLIVAGLTVPGSEMTLINVGLNPTRIGFLDTLLEMGADIRLIAGPDQAGEPSGKLTVRYSQLHGVAISGERVVRMIDEFPAFAIAACLARGRSRVTGAEELRLKETDRIAAICLALAKLGAQITELPDGFIIDGGSPLSGGQLEVQQDHRIAMALAVAGLAGAGELRLRGAEIIAESYPEFVADLQGLGAKLREVGGEPIHESRGT